MQISAKSKYIRISPFKLRPTVDLLRGKSLAESLAYLQAHMNRRACPILKVLNSAYANAKNLHKDIDSAESLIVKTIKVDQGPMLKYFTPSAMGKAAPQKKRLSHISVILEKRAVEKKEEKVVAPKAKRTVKKVASKAKSATKIKKVQSN
jgi:large subunit ribosomal protein L22